MLQNIEITVKNKIYKIEWAMSEHFEELKGRTFMLNEVAAEQIEMINDLSVTAKILLSAIAGAVIQHLIDKELQIDMIFNSGKLIVIK